MNSLDRSAASFGNGVEAEPTSNDWRELLNGLDLDDDGHAILLLDHLHALMGGDFDAARRWLHTDNLDLGCSPYVGIAEGMGVEKVADYLAGYRYKS